MDDSLLSYCFLIISTCYVEERNAGSQTSRLPHDFTPLGFSLIIPIYYFRGLWLNLKIEWIISFVINNNTDYLLMRAQVI